MNLLRLFSTCVPAHSSINEWNTPHCVHLTSAVIDFNDKIAIQMFYIQRHLHHAFCSPEAMTLLLDAPKWHWLTNRVKKDDCAVHIFSLLSTASALSPLKYHLKLNRMILMPRIAAHVSAQGCHITHSWGQRKEAKSAFLFKVIRGIPIQRSDWQPTLIRLKVLELPAPLQLHSHWIWMNESHPTNLARQPTKTASTKISFKSHTKSKWQLSKLVHLLSRVLANCVCVCGEWQIAWKLHPIFFHLRRSFPLVRGAPSSAILAEEK